MSHKKGRGKCPFLCPLFLFKMMKKLTISEHNRDCAGLRYIYPVLSRRAGGLSVGINFNTNNACNWRCIYCQVPDLQRGIAPELNLTVLAKELHGFLCDVLYGDFFDRFQIESEKRIIKDVAISGNGEATTLKQFAEAIRLIGNIVNDFSLLSEARFVLISNGSLNHQSWVQDGLKYLNYYRGEMWFKLDSATLEGRHLLNNCRLSNEAIFNNLQIASQLCKVKLQTCMFHYQNIAWSEVEKQAYLDFLIRLKGSVVIDSVMLYSLARPSLQPEAPELVAMAETEMLAFAARIEQLGYNVDVSP